MASKVEGMILHTNDSHKIQVNTTTLPTHTTTHTTTNTSTTTNTISVIQNPIVVRTAPQEHNVQLLNLLAQLRESVEKTPVQVLAKSTHSASGASGSGSHVGGGSGSGVSGSGSGSGSGGGGGSVVVLTCIL